VRFSGHFPQSVNEALLALGAVEGDGGDRQSAILKPKCLAQRKSRIVKRRIGSAICTIYLGRFVQSIRPFTEAMVSPPPQVSDMDVGHALFFRQAAFDCCGEKFGIAFFDSRACERKHQLCGSCYSIKTTKVVIVFSEVSIPGGLTP